jgi:Bacteriocin-protection, YdeI or OmpD-Associated/Domain of unknown function (DUF1905)
MSGVAIERHNFTGKVEAVAIWERMQYDGIRVPPEINVALQAAGHKRVIYTLRGHTYRRALMPEGDEAGTYYLIVSHQLRRQAGLSLGEPLEIVIWSDPEPDSLDIPEELEWALADDERAQAAWQSLPLGRRRGLCYQVSSAKGEATRARRAVTIVGHLATGTLPSGRRP